MGGCRKYKDDNLKFQELLSNTPGRFRIWDDRGLFTWNGKSKKYIWGSCITFYCHQKCDIGLTCHCLLKGFWWAKHVKTNKRERFLEPTRHICSQHFVARQLCFLAIFFWYPAPCAGGGGYEGVHHTQSVIWFRAYSSTNLCMAFVSTEIRTPALVVRSQSSIDGATPQLAFLAIRFRRISATLYWILWFDVSCCEHFFSFFSNLLRRADYLFLEEPMTLQEKSYLSGVSNQGSCHIDHPWYTNNLISDTWDCTPHLRAVTVVSQTHGVLQGPSKDPPQRNEWQHWGSNRRSLLPKLAFLTTTLRLIPSCEHYTN